MAMLQTVAALSTFFLAMVKYPVVQANGHAELDKVLGRNQLPNFNDEDSLPYITAISMEVLRWQVSSWRSQRMFERFVWRVSSSERHSSGDTPPIH